MKDRLEKFILDNRTDFDSEHPSNELWSKIEGDLSPTDEKVGSAYFWVWKVAAMLFLGATITLGILLKNSVNDRVTASNGNGYNPELVEVESYYTRMISQKSNEIDKYLQQLDIQETGFLNDLAMLNQLYVDLQKDLKENRNNDKLINAMIQNLQLRVEILNKQLSILEQIKNYKDNEKVTI